MERFKTRYSSDSIGAPPRTPASALPAAARVLVAAIAVAVCTTTSANGQTYQLGRTPAEAEIKAADTAIAPDGRGLPPGNGSAREGAAILRRARERIRAGEPAHERLEVALLGSSYSSVSARREADAEIANLRDPGGPARGSLQATTLATLALDEVMYLRSASTAVDLAERAIAAGLPLEPHRGENWAILALVALAGADGLDTALRCADEMLVRARGTVCCAACAPA